MYRDRFDDILKQMSDLHTRKGADYGTEADPYANVRASAEFGVAPWLGAIIRLNDKMTRLKAFATKGMLANESIEDAFRDIQVYAVIAQILYEEGQEAAKPTEFDYIKDYFNIRAGLPTVLPHNV